VTRPNPFVGCLPKDRAYTHRIRALLRSVWPEDEVNAWMLREQRALGGATVVAAIGADRHAEVSALVMSVMARYAVHIPVLDRPRPGESVSERMPA
jgi:hypothetical protein